MKINSIYETDQYTYFTLNEKIDIHGGFLTKLTYSWSYYIARLHRETEEIYSYYVSAFSGIKPERTSETTHQQITSTIQRNKLKLLIHSFKIEPRLEEIFETTHQVFISLEQCIQEIKEMYQEQVVERGLIWKFFWEEVERSVKKECPEDVQDFFLKEIQEALNQLRGEP
jgi:hypothetical protein